MMTLFPVLSSKYQHIKHLTTKYISSWTSNWNFLEMNTQPAKNWHKPHFIPTDIWKAEIKEHTPATLIGRTLPPLRGDSLPRIAPNRLPALSLKYSAQRAECFSEKNLRALWGIFARDAGNAAAVTLTMMNGGETSFVFASPSIAPLSGATVTPLMAQSASRFERGANMHDGKDSLLLLLLLVLIWPPGLHHPPVQLSPTPFFMFRSRTQNKPHHSRILQSGFISNV